LLDWRNTPTEGIETSPAQGFLERRCKTLLFTASSLLKLRYAVGKDKKDLNWLKDKQKFYYNRHTKPLLQFCVGDTVHMQRLGEKTYTRGVCVGESGPISYEMKVGSQYYQRNRRQLRLTKEPQELVLPKWQPAFTTCHTKIGTKGEEQNDLLQQENLFTKIKTSSNRVRNQKDTIFRNMQNGTMNYYLL